MRGDFHAPDVITKSWKRKTDALLRNTGAVGISSIVEKRHLLVGAVFAHVIAMVGDKDDHGLAADAVGDITITVGVVERGEHAPGLAVHKQTAT